MPVVIGFEHTDLPYGLNAIALPTDDGGPQLLLSESLAPAEQRAAAVTAIRAAKRAGWIGQRDQVALLLPIAAASLRHVIAGLLAHLTTAKGIATTAAAATVAGVAAVVVTVTPAINLHVIPSAPHAAKPPPGHVHGAASVPAPHARSARTHTTARQAPHPTVLGSGSAPPTTSSAPPAPSPSASVSVHVSVAPPPPPVCVIEVLGIKVCL